MDKVITIDFTGLCVFVRKDAPERLKVILATDPKRKMKHRPVLSMNFTNVAKVEEGSFDQAIQLPNGEQIASWRLDDCIVRFKGEEKAYPRGVMLHGAGIPSSECPQDPGSERELCWVPSLKRASGEGNVNSVYLTDKPVPEGPSALAARVDLTRGYMYANAEVNRRFPIEAWSFPKAHGSTFAQYLADTVRLEMRLPDDLPAIQIINFKTGAAQTIWLEPEAPLTELSITNLPDAMPEHGDHERKMPHFDLYYELLDPVPKSRPIPELPSGGTSMPGTMAGPSDGDMIVRAFGIRPVKCTPGMTP